MARQQSAPAHAGARYVWAGGVYLALGAILLVIWLTVGGVLLLLLVVSTLVAGLVEVAVGWPRLRREQALRRRVR